MERGALTAERIRELLAYDAGTGSFCWRVTTSNRATAGSIAGSPDGHGYVKIKVDGRLYMAHRLAWLHVYAVWPVGSVDHINGVGTDNRIANLRDVDHSTNMQNQRRANYDSKSGLLGVAPHGNNFRARIQLAGKQRHLGTFSTAEEAHAAYIAAKREIHAGCTL